MLKVWGRRNSVNVQKVLWCLAELGVAYEREDAGLQYGRNDEPWFLALNPNGQIPLIDDAGFTLWESNSIVRYLCAKFDNGGLYPSDPAARAAAERWMDWQLSTLGRPVGIVFWNLVRTPAPRRDMQAVARAAAAAERAFEILDGHLTNHDYVGGDRFTMGDIPVGALTHRWLALDGLQRRPRPALQQWYARLTAREPYRDHVMLPLS